MGGFGTELTRAENGRMCNMRFSRSVVIRWAGSVALTLALVMGAAACSDDPEDNVDQIEEDLEDSADEVEENLDDLEP